MFFSGKESDDSRLLTESEDASLSVTVNKPGAYKTVRIGNADPP